MKKRVLAVVMCALMAGSVFTGFKDAGDDKELVLFTWEGMFPDVYKRQEYGISELCALSAYECCGEYWLWSEAEKSS